MVNYPTTFNFGDPCGRFYGPTDEASRNFPAHVFLTSNEWDHYNAEIFTKRQIEAQQQFPGEPNPYDKYVQEGLARLAALPPLPAKPCGDV